VREKATRQEVSRVVSLPTVAMTERPYWPGLSAVGHHRAMVALILSFLGSLRFALRIRADLALENLALRQQLINLRRTYHGASVTPMSAAPT
jgi:hypothetical protein